MDRNTAVSRVKRGLAFRQGTSLDSDIIDALQDAQLELEKEQTLPWFLLSEVSSISTVDGEERIKVPSDFIREWEDDPLWYFNGDADEAEDKWTALAKDDLENLRETHPGEGAPRAYQLDIKYFRIFPTPDEAYVLKMIYYKNATVLDTNIENLWLEHTPWLLIGMAGTVIAAAIRDKDALEIFAALTQKHKDIMIKDTEARRHTNKRYIMGGPD